MTSLWRQRWLLAVAFAVASGAALGISLAVQPVYRAVASIAVADAAAAGGYARRATSSSTLESAAEAVTSAEGRAASIRELRTAVSASVVAGTDTVDVEAAGADPARAQRLATAVARALAAGAEPAHGVRLVEAAARPRDPVSPRPVRNGIVAGSAAAGALAAALLSSERARRRIRNESDVARLLGPVPVAVIAAQRGVDPGEPVMVAAPDSAAAADFADLAAALVAAGPPKRVVVTAAGRGDGRTTVAANLAVALAAEGLRVVILDADFRRPQVAQLFDVPEEPGLGDVLGTGLALGRAARPTEIPGLWAIPAGPARGNPADLLDMAELEAVLQEVDERTDVAVLDAPPLSEEPEGASVARKADALLLTVRGGRTQRSSLARAAAMLARAGLEASVAVVLGAQSRAGGPRSVRDDRLGPPEPAASEPAEGPFVDEPAE